jgi:hypothetical protein
MPKCPLCGCDTEAPAVAVPPVDDAIAAYRAKWVWCSPCKGKVGDLMHTGKVDG